jgi:mannitol/fructose-specific phosphotransferase system IIA component (Ntr-type)
LTSTPEGGLWEIKEAVLRELVELLDKSGKVANKSKLLTDLLNRERKASTAIGQGLAIPHVRTLQARDFIIAFARSSAGIDFDAIDGQKVHIFFCTVSPPYDDSLYLNVYKNIAVFMSNEQRRKTLFEAEDAHEIVRVISDFEV